MTKRLVTRSRLLMTALLAGGTTLLMLGLFLSQSEKRTVERLLTIEDMAELDSELALIPNPEGVADLLTQRVAKEGNEDLGVGLGPKDDLRVGLGAMTLLARLEDKGMVRSRKSALQAALARISGPRSRFMIGYCLLTLYGDRTGLDECLRSAPALNSMELSVTLGAAPVSMPRLHIEEARGRGDLEALIREKYASVRFDPIRRIWIRGQ